MSLEYPDEVNEGWGITELNKQLVISDGSDMLHFVNPDLNNFNLIKSVKVFSDGNTDIRKINELEMAYGYIFANVWLDKNILIIDPLTGKIVR
jgi:glutamine cyclotransferase